MSSLSDCSCAICYRPSNAFNYGVLSCNACKMFFRRAALGKSEKFCKNQGSCDQKNTILECRDCRFKKCVNLGMKLSTNQYANLSDLIKNLSKWNLERSNKLLNYQCAEDPSLEQVTLRFPIFTKKCAQQSFTKSDWGFMEQLTTIDLISKFEFAQLLDPKDLLVVLKSSTFKIASFVKAVRSYSLKSAELQYPAGDGIVPDELVPFCTTKFLERVQCRLIGKLIELNIKEEEFLLLTSVLLCDPATSNLSDNAAAVISHHQKIYSGALFQYCLLTYRQEGPSRFTELLSVCHVINRHVEDIRQLCFMYVFRPPARKYKILCAQLLGS